MKISVFNPKDLAEGITVDEHLVKGSKPGNISATLLPEGRQEPTETAEMEFECH